jgi:hypothetical protein
VIEVARSATETAPRIVRLVDADRARVCEFGRGAASALRVHDLASRRIVINAGDASEQLGLSSRP